MASPTMSYLICTTALIVLILVMPYFFEIQRDSIANEMTRRELTEIADYTSNTLANLFFLAQTSQSSNVNITKELMYLPLTVGDSFYVLSITVDGDSSKVTAYLRDQPWISGESWLVPGLEPVSEELEVKGNGIVASCYGGSAVFFGSIGYGL